MTKELFEIMRRCQAAGLRCDYDGSCLIVNFPGTFGVFICEGGHDQWVLEEVEERFEEFEALEGFPCATWSPSQRMIECNLVEVDPEVRARVALGRMEHLASYDEDWKRLQEEVQRIREGKRPNVWWNTIQSVEVTRQERIQTILLRLAQAQNRSEYSEAVTNPKQRIFIDSDTNLKISIGLSSNVHALVQEESSEPGRERSLTLQVKGAKVNTQEQAAEALVRIANSVFFAIDEAIGLSLALERNPNSRNAIYSRVESFPVAAVDSEYDPDAISLYWSGKNCVQYAVDPVSCLLSGDRVLLRQILEARYMEGDA